MNGARMLMTLAALLPAAMTHHARAVTIDWVTVTDPGNTGQTLGYWGMWRTIGSVADAFRIGKYEITNQQYADFLNAAARTDTYSLYSGSMGSEANGGIMRSGSSGSYTYEVKANMGNKPVIYVSWFDAARMANWLHNGRGSGGTETGAYSLNGAITGDAPDVNHDATFYIPTEDQWYKAAYYKGGGTNAGYWEYATQSDTAPTAVTANLIGDGSAGSMGNFANIDHGVSWNSQIGNVTTVGTNGRSSYYGAFDMGGNVDEWSDLPGVVGPTRGLRGGNWTGHASFTSSLIFSGQADELHPNGSHYTGFRLASPVPVPEPSTWVMGLAGIACVGWGARRRKRSLTGGRLPSTSRA